MQLIVMIAENAKGGGITTRHHTFVVNNRIVIEGVCCKSRDVQIVLNLLLGVKQQFD